MLPAFEGDDVCRGEGEYGGIIGAEACAKAPPDGYTLCAIYSATTSINPHVFDKLPYDPAKDFAPITNVGNLPGYLVLVNAPVPAQSLPAVWSVSAVPCRPSGAV
ncbi:tripartite tricarboxylate transporter substrate-binding protein [Undibacterium luofuense]|uniref:tripartite tricarboxylate transporter substrate-binding protein n=1 Tax=Undibacterium luofuense TaxID=2828733 RepID=UPI0030EC2436